MKNKKVVIILIILIVLGLGIGLFFIFKDDNSNEISDSEKFAKEYPVISSDNVFVYRDANEIIKILENGTGVVYLGFPECKWCQAYVKYLDEVSKEVGIEKIYYYNILEDRTNNTDDYKKIVNILKEYLQYDDEGNERIFVPNVSFHVDGKIIGNDYETSKDTHNLAEPEEYWTEEEIKDLKTNLTKYMQKVDEASRSCTDCNK